MMINRTLINAFIPILVLLAGVACGKKTPEGLLSKEEMVKAFRDIYIRESQVSRLGLTYDSSGRVFEDLRSRSFADLGIDDPAFIKSYDWYSEHPNELNEIYAAVIDSLNLMEQRLSLPKEVE